MSLPLNCAEYEQLAERLVEPGPWAYLAGGAMDESTLRANVEAFRRWTFRPRVLVDVDVVSTETTVLGRQLSLPVLVAPIAFHGLYHADGELATARAAAAEGTVMCVSTMTSHTHLAVAEAAPGLDQWAQLYVLTDEGATRAHLDDVVAAGCTAIVLTVDTPVVGRRERDLRVGFGVPASLPLPYAAAALGNVPHSPATHNRLFSASLTWRDIEWIAAATKLPVLLKGVLTREDALLAVEHGAAGVIVSNHGGRQLDGVRSSISALPKIAQAVGSDLEVYMDGGVRSGLDVLKAMALGARACFVGRAWAYALGAGGEATVARMLATLRSELSVAMILTGCANLADAGRELLDSEA